MSIHVPSVASERQCGLGIPPLTRNIVQHQRASASPRPGVLTQCLGRRKRARPAFARTHVPQYSLIGHSPSHARFLNNSLVRAEAELPVGGGGGNGGRATGGGGGGGGGSGGDAGGDSSNFLELIGASYLALLQSHPIVTKGLTAGLLNAIADLFCQIVVERREKIDVRRVGSFAAIGFFIVGPCLHVWFSLLSQFITLPGTPGVLLRLLVDQAIFSPSSIAVFFGLVLLLEGRLQELPGKLKKDMLPTVINMWKLWIPAQFLVFAVVPLPLQVLASNTVGVVWTVYMSYASHNDVIQDSEPAVEAKKLP